MSNFTQAQIAAAQLAQKKWGVPASVTLAQFAIESGYGKYMPAGSNNPFGIKAAGGQPYVVAHTREETAAGKSYYIDARFRKFANLAEAFEEHARLLATASPYAAARAAWAHHHDLSEYVRLMGARYATSTVYAATILSVIHGQNLTQFDATSPSAPVAVVNPRPPEPTHDTAWVQQSLNTLGATPTLAVDGIAGPQTLAAIKWAQRAAGLVQDGIVGTYTLAAIEAALAKRSAA